MAMSAAQTAAFNGASGITAGNLSLLVTSIFATLMLLWLGWLIFGAYKAWTERHIDVVDGAWWVLRASLWVSLMTWLVR